MQAYVLSLNCGFEVWLECYRDRLNGVPLDSHKELSWAFLSPERLAQPPIEINSHLRSLGNNTSDHEYRRVRAIFMGPGGAGKSSLVRAMHGEPVVAGQEAITQGVAIYTSSKMMHDVAGVFTRETMFPERDLTVHFWDFGGQVMAHATHQFFLRAHCLYVIVLDARAERNVNDEAEYWLEHVRAFGDNSPVMIVGNKVDQVAVDVDQRTLREKSPNVTGFYPPSCTQAKGRYRAEFDRFPRDFNEKLLELGARGERLTAPQFDVLREVLAVADTDDFLSHDTFSGICQRNGISSTSAAGMLLDLLDKLGVVVYFPKFTFLNDYILNPRWLTYGVYTIMYSEQAKLAHGRLTEDAVVTILSVPVESSSGRAFRYSRERCGLVVEIMVAFGIAYRLKGDTTQIVIPGLLEPKQPEHDFKGNGALAFRFDFKGFLPRNVLPALIVNHNEDIARFNGAEVVWQNGVLLRPDRGIDAEALVMADYHNRNLDLLVTGSDAVMYLSLLRDGILKTLKTMPELPFEETVQVRPDMRLDREDAERFGDRPIWLSYPVIKTAQKKRIKALPGSDGYLYDMERVLNVVPISHELRPADVFISYSTEDRQIVESLRGEIESARYAVWFDQELIGGQKFRNVIDKRIDASKAVIVVWTENSIDSDYVVCEAEKARKQKKLISIRDPGLDIERIPAPFSSTDHLLKIGDSDGLRKALSRLIKAASY